MTPRLAVPAPASTPAPKARKAGGRGAEVVPGARASVDPQASGSAAVKDYQDPGQVFGPAQTESESFKAWFGASKFVDAKKKPVVGHHGTNQVFTSFDPARIGEGTDQGWLGQGFYFSTDPAVVGTGSKLMDVPVYLRVVDPLEVLATSWGNKQEMVSRALGSEVMLSSQEITARLKARKHDGVILDYSPLGYLHREVMVLLPTQIKSALANCGDFDPENPDICS